MIKKIYALTAVTLMGLPLFAAPQVVEGQDPKPAAMVPGQMYYNYRLTEMSKWAQGPERQLLNLFPGFRDVLPKGGQEQVLFIAKTSMIVDRPANSIDFSKFTQLAEIQSVQNDLAKLDPVNPADIGPVKKDFLAYKNPKSGWCAEAQTLCMKMTILLPDEYAMALHAAQFAAMKDVADIEAEAQVKVEAGAAIQDAAAWSSFTGVGTAPTTIVKEDIFYVNQLMEFGKIVGVVQPHPVNPNQSILTGYTVFAIDKKWWTMGAGDMTLDQVFLGKRFNSTSGLPMGLPKVTQKIFGDLLEKL